MDRLLRFLLKTFIRRGNFRVTTSRGTVLIFGDGSGPPVSVRFATRAAEWGILLDPELKLGESYMNGTFVVEEGSIADVLAIALGQDSEVPHWAKPQFLIRYLWRRIKQFNPRKRSRQNVAHHYDLDGRLYSLFLDADRQYSCAYFERPDQSLDDAQLAKKRHLAAKLRLSPDRKDLRILDIGCGWGGLGLYLAEYGNANVTGITLSQEQHAVANERAVERGLSARARFILQDYRDLNDSFDRIVSVGMFEHVGVNHFETYFNKAAELLKDDGVMVLHSIGRSEGPSVTNPWISKYIFPGGYIPSLSEVLPKIEKSGLLVTDIEILRLHYAETLKHWRERFLAHREEVERIYDRRFVRMWEFYLAASEMSFREQDMMVFQIQLTKRQDVVPITRDYIMREEQRLRVLEDRRQVPLRLAGE
ncbi:SAM-dependent methyltransferase [Undibacter mobilis]|uniref:Class I SAM-dependent methyltransferase n=1 Tax=Undibacter mobilis TaxID=2292256 RepID=A0A371B4K8_9BRAD|nr:cyclopropane-fatty-acyl-phospholipid synthase family protein [Undibacter mobilis]RDV02373.1 class I SAM-dependent methyltransferase [Undibacter mobilis]